MMLIFFIEIKASLPSIYNIIKLRIKWDSKCMCSFCDLSLKHRCNHVGVIILYLLFLNFFTIPLHNRWDGWDLLDHLGPTWTSLNTIMSSSCLDLLPEEHQLFGGGQKKIGFCRPTWNISCQRNMCDGQLIKQFDQHPTNPQIFKRDSPRSKI